MSADDKYKIDAEKGEKSDAHQTLSSLFFSYWYALGPRPRAHILQLSFFIICLAAILPWYYASVNRSNSNVYIFPSNASNYGLTAEINIQTIDPLLLQTSVSIVIIPTGNFSLYSVSGEEADEGVLYFSPDYINSIMLLNNIGPASPTTSVKASLYVFFTKVGYTEVPSDQIVPSFSQIYPLVVEKALAYYPLDSYSSQFYVSMLIELSNVNVTGGIFYAAVPYAIKITNLVSGWDNTPNVFATNEKKLIPVSDSNIVQVNFNFKRLGVIQGFSIFIVIVMWIISLAVFTLAFDNYFVQPLMKEVNPAAAGLASGLLFALPALRVVQPGIPSLVSYLLVDVCGFYLNMGIVAISVFLMISKLDWCQWQPKEANVPKP